MNINPSSFFVLHSRQKEDDRDYCLITYPYTSRILPLLQLFSRVQCRPSRKLVRDDLPAPYMLTHTPPDPKVADNCLYLIHRDSLMEEFVVRIARLRDAEPLVEFLEHIKDRRSIVDLIENPRRGCSTIVAALSTQIVGFAMIEDNVPVQALATHFSIKSLVDLEQHPANKHGCITLFTMNPVFRHRRRLFLREIMRLVNKTILYCPIFPKQELPDVLEDLLLVPPQQHALMSPAMMWGRNVETGPNRRASLRRSSFGLAGFSPRGIFNGFDCALYLTTHRLASRYRIVVNSRIVVAGASRTAEAFLHKLIANSQMQFTNVSLISPSGFSPFSSHAASILDGDPGPGRAFCKLGIDCQVALKVAAVRDLHRKAQKVQLSNGDLVPYDILILATGLQDQTRVKLKLEGMKSVMRVDDFLSQMDNIISSLDKFKVPREAVPPGEGFVVVYGATLEAFYMVQLLLSKGVKGSNVVLAHPEQHLAACSSGDANILSCLIEELSWAHVCVVSGCKLIAASADDSGNLKSVIFEKSGQGGSGKYQLVSCLLVTCGRKQVDVPLFNAMRRENLVFDGRIIVDGRFQTNDSFIFAAGTAVKFSRRCGKLPRVESFCSAEVGEALACSMMSKFVPSHVPDVGKLWSSNFPLPDFRKMVTPVWPTTPTPIFRRGKCIGGIFPGGSYHFSIVDPVHYLKKWESLTVHSLLTKCNQFYTRFDFVESKQLARVLYCGKMKVCTWKFQQLVGLPAMLLNNLLNRYRVGELNDIIEHIGQPWCAVLLHDQFKPFYHKLTEEVVSASLRHPKGDDLPLEPLEGLHPDFAGQTVSLIEHAMINFINENRNDLPMYRLPRKKMDTQLLLPKVLDEDCCEAQEQHKVAASEAAARARIALLEVVDMVKAILERVAFKQEIRFAIDRVVDHVEGLRPVLLSLKGWGYLGVDHLVEEIKEQVMTITVWDPSPARQAERLQDATEMIEKIIQRLERTEQIEMVVDNTIGCLGDKLDHRFRTGYG